VPLPKCLVLRRFVAAASAPSAPKSASGVLGGCAAHQVEASRSTWSRAGGEGWISLWGLEVLPPAVHDAMPSYCHVRFRLNALGPQTVSILAKQRNVKNLRPKMIRIGHPWPSVAIHSHLGRPGTSVSRPRISMQRWQMLRRRWCWRQQAPPRR
jgi:hypothetical protein